MGIGDLLCPFRKCSKYDMRESGDFEYCPPNADAMIQSMRAFGYDLSMAVADIVDNSISAGARNVWIIQNWSGAESYIAILDDGSGMNEQRLFEAMRLGSNNPLDERDADDLGRFGLGLKTASFSQCRLLTVRSKTNDGVTATRCWDIDHVSEVRDWHLIKTARPDSERILAHLDKVKRGTVVLWQRLDRVVEIDDVDSAEGKSDFLRKVDNVREYLEMVFHRYLGPGGKLKIYLGGPADFAQEFTKLKPWDPFLTSHDATQELSNEALALFGNNIRVRPYVLPHISKLSDDEHSRAAGPKGWNAQQGFYVYRKERLIVAGSWLDLGLKQEEHCKLARILVDIPNNTDAEWKIDVKKAEAHPPDALRGQFLRIAKLTRSRATEVYRFRGKIIVREHDNVNRFVWKKTGKRGKVKYQVDRKHPLVERLLDKDPISKKDIGILIRLIESTVPVEQIVITNSENPDAHVGTYHEGDYGELPIEKWFIDQIRIQLRKGLSKEDAFRLVCTMEPFNLYPELLARMDEIEDGE